MMGYEPHSSYGQRETKRENNGENEFRTTEEIDVFFWGGGGGGGGGHILPSGPRKLQTAMRLY